MKYTFIILVVLFSACGNKKKASTTKETPTVTSTVVTLSESQRKTADIETSIATRQSMKSLIHVSGKIDVPPQNMVSVSFPLGGYLKSSKLLPGMHINKGEVIAIMEDQQYIQLQQDYLTAQARQQYLESEYQRQRELNKSKASSDKVFQQAEADYQSNRILISSLKQKLQLIGINPSGLSEHTISRTVSVHAPIAGFVSEVKVNIGRYVTPSDVMFELVNPTDIHLALTVFEKDLNQLSIGQKIVAYTNSQPDMKHSGEIILIGKDVSAERSVQVHCHFDHYDPSLVPGMYMNADIEVNNMEAWTLPEDAVVRYGNKQFVFIEKGKNTFEMKEVITGSAENGTITINTAAINLKTQQIVTKNAYTLLMKLKNTSEEE